MPKRWWCYEIKRRGASLLANRPNDERQLVVIIMSQHREKTQTMRGKGMKMEAGELEKKVSQHEEAINQDILPRLEKLEKVTTEFQEKVGGLTNDVTKVQTGQAELAKGQKDLELTMVKEGQANRDVIKETKDVANKLLDHVLRVDEKEKDTEAEFTRKKIEAEELRATEKMKTDSEIRKARWEIIGKVAVGLIGGTSIIAVIIQAFL